MEPDRWRQIKEVFNAALERPADERAIFLVGACSSDETLKKEVESLLVAHQDTATTLGATAAAQPARASDDALPGRRLGPYQVIRRIGQGGMAAVYLALRADAEYKKRVAIKLVSPGLESEELLARFRNERQTLAALDHPDIVKLLDGGTTEDGLPYLVMDYVDGMPITDYCDSHRLSTTERLELFRKVCAAVSYAHQRLVIHRDLKPANILVTADGIPKLLDFGIAKLVNPEVLVRTIVVTRTGQRLMTPEYASPEQARGEPLTNATDIYSLGVVLYELLTGHRPYRLKSYVPLEIERAICEREPEKPSVVISRVEDEAHADGTSTRTTPEEISRIREGDPKKLRKRLYGDPDAIVMTALRKEPQRRYASVYEFSEDIRRHLQGLPVQARPSTLAYRVSKFVRRHKEATIAPLIVLLVVGSLTTWEARRSRLELTGVQRQLSTVKPRRSIAVLGFKNLSRRPDASWLSTALSEMLATELAAGEKLRTVSGETVAKTKINLSLPEADTLSPATLAKVRQNLGTDLVVLGSYVDLEDGQIRLDLRLEDAVAGEMIAAIADTGTEANLFDLVSRTGADLRQKLGISAVTSNEALNVKASLPENPEAARLYAEGLAKLRLFDSQAARVLFQRAIAADPNDALSHSALSAAWSDLGYDAKAKLEAQKALELSTSLSREAQLTISARNENVMHHYDKALEIYQRLWTLYPDNVEYGLQVAMAQMSVGKPQVALATLEELRKLPVPVRDDPNIDLRAADAYKDLGDVQQALAAARRAKDKSRSQGARLLLAWALNQEAWALQTKGDLEGAITSAQESMHIFQSSGDEAGAAWDMTVLAEILAQRGDRTGSIRLLENALQVFHRIGHALGEAGTLNNLATQFALQGDLARAKKMYGQALSIFRQIDERRGSAQAQNNIAMILAQEGELIAAHRMYTLALTAFQDNKDASNSGLTMTNIGDVLRQQGELENAAATYRQAISTLQHVGDKSILAYGVQGLGDVLLSQGDLGGARRQYTEALSLRNEIGEPGTAAESRLALAQLSLEEGNSLAAGDALKDVLDEFRKENTPDDAILASATYAECLLAQQQPEVALEQIRRGKQLLPKSQNWDVQVRFEIAAARVLAASGKSSASENSLQRILTQTTRSGSLSRNLEARLALGEVEIRSRQAATGRTRLETLERDARARGFGLIAHKAAAARVGS